MAQILTLTSCLHWQREPGCSASCNTRNHSSVSNPPSILQWLSAINTLQVGSCHNALALKDSDSVTAGELRAWSRPAPATCSGRSNLCQDTGWWEASGITLCQCPSWTACCRAACLGKAGQKPLPATCLPPYGGHLKSRHFHKETLELFIHQMQFWLAQLPQCSHLMVISTVAFCRFAVGMSVRKILRASN